jgi:hypothetical protein
MFVPVRLGILRLLSALLLFFLTVACTGAKAQSVIGYANTVAGPFFVAFNTLDCSFCPIMPAPPVFNDVFVLPNGNILVMRPTFPNSQITIYTPPSNNPIQTFVVPLMPWYDAVQGPGNLLYVSGMNGLYTFDFTSGALTFIGQWPMANPFIMSELLLIDGVYYGVGGVINSGIINFYRLDMLDPSQSVLLHSDIGIIYQDGPFAISNGPTPGLFIADFSPGNQTLQTYDTLTNTFSPLCPLAPNLGAFYNEIPPGVSYSCLCFNDAGTIPNQIANLCIDEIFTFTHTGGFLENDDIRQFILFTNPNDTLGSIIATSNTPSFSFDPLVMQTGVTYYAAAIAGNDLNGNVDLDDPCLDISNTAAQVTWRPLPAVVFSLANPDVCPGECRTVTATFTGTSPFSLTYSTPLGTFTQSFAGNTGTFQVCAPAGAPPGALTVQATALTDAWCTCN